MRKYLLTQFLLCLFAIPLLAQDRTVSGKITTTEDGSPVPGVNVSVKGTTRGTTTDASGNYQISGKPEDKLVVSAVGFVSQEIAIGNQSKIDIALVSDARELSEVVVNGLASSVKRSNLANSVQSITPDNLVRTRPPTLDASLSGKIVGANIVANSGAPGGGVSIKLRGISSINGSSEPLYIVDGVFINNSQFQTGAGTGAFNGATGAASGSQDQATNRLADINPADIENIEILKGPSAAAIYGTRANAGVIIITTKRGKAGKTRISVGQDVGFVTAQRLLGSSSWSEDKIRQFGGIYGVGTEDALELFQASNGQTYDYEKEVYGNTGVINNTRLSLSGGNERTNFYIAGGYNDETGIQKRTGFTRASIRANVSHRLSDRIDFSLNSNYINSDNQRSFSGNDNNGVSLGYTLAYTPNFLNLFPVNGVYPENPGTGQNPLEIVDRAVNNEITNRFIQAFNTNIDLFQRGNTNLRFAFQGGVDYLNTESEVYMPDDLQYQLARANPGASRYTKSRNLNTNLQGSLVFDTKAGGLNLNTQLVAVRLTTNRDISWIQGEGLVSGQRNPSTAAVRSVSETFQRWQDVGVTVQQEANYRDRIVGTVGFRWDKSSLNGDNAKWFFFPRASLAVNVANFDFWRVSFMNQLKLRAAFGRTGGVPIFGDTFTSLGTSVIDSRLGISTPTAYGNAVLQPETAQEIEFGLDMGFLNNRIGFEATYYDKDVFDLLQAYTLSPGTGVTSIVAYPIGDMQNRGVELGLSLTPVQNNNITWTTNFAYWQNRTKVTRLAIPNTYVGNGFGAFGRNRLVVGQSPTRWYGTPLVEGQPTAYGDAQPKFQLSWTNNIKFLRNFDLSFLLHTSYKGYNSTLTREVKDEGGTTLDWSNDDDGDGTPNGQDERLFGSAGNNTGYFIQDATYIRLREVALYYTVPKQVLGRAFKNYVEGVRLGVSGNNLFTKTNYFGYDPEASNFGNASVGSNVDLMPFPSTKRVFFHVAIDF